MELARQLRTKREERGFSQDEVAKAIFVSRQTISNWENDKTYPDMQSLLLLSQLFDTSIDDLVKGDAARIQQAVKQDSHKMRLLSYGMVGFSILAFLFLLGFSLAWQEPSGFARMSKGNIAGAITFIVLYAIGFGMAIAIDRLKKKHDIVTYREIDRFLKGEIGEEPDSQGLSRSLSVVQRSGCYWPLSCWRLEDRCSFCFPVLPPCSMSIGAIVQPDMESSISKTT